MVLAIRVWAVVFFKEMDDRSALEALAALSGPERISLCSQIARIELLRETNVNAIRRKYFGTFFSLNEFTSVRRVVLSSRSGGS